MIVKCCHCSIVDLTKNFEVIDQYEPHFGIRVFLGDKENEEEIEEAHHKRQMYENLDGFDDPGEAEIDQFIASSTMDTDDELFARIFLWHKSNDGRRESIAQLPLSSSERDNLQHIVQLFDSPNRKSLLLAEAHRELGHLKVAKKLIEATEYSSDGENDAAQFILELIEQGISQVCLIEEESGREWRYQRRLERRKKASRPLPTFDPAGPPIFYIESRNWWVKPLEMLVHNWALIESNEDGSATIYFFHDQGVTRGRNKYDLNLLKGRCAVIDSLEFASEAKARHALEYNNFHELEEYPGPWYGAEPFGTFYDARETEEGIYSKGKYWRHL